MARRQIAELALAPLPVALSEEAPRAHGDLGLDLLISGPLGIEARVQEGIDADLLVVLEGELPTQSAHDTQGHDEGQERLDAQSGERRDREEQRDEAERGAQIRLRGDQQ